MLEPARAARLLAVGLAGLLLASSAVGAEPQEPVGSLVVTATLRSDEGNVLVSVFAGADGFPDDPDQAVKRVTGPVAGSAATVTLSDLPHGTYAVSVCHDENGNGECDENWLGLPKEGTGLSNDARASLGPPKFEDDAGVLDSPEKAIQISVHY